MEFRILGDEILFKNIRAFNLEFMVNSGQAFRWKKDEDGYYVTVTKDYVIKARQRGDRLFVKTSHRDSLPFIVQFFDLNRDYESIEKKVAEDPALIPALSFSSGNRIFMQDPWECTISYIVSQNNSIHNIIRVIERMCKRYGEPIRFEGRTYYKFPSPQRLAGLTEEELMECRGGYRCSYIIESARKIAAGEVDLYDLREKSTDEARQELLKLVGVGNKVADCILLFSLQKYDAFPVDVWIKRAVEKLYFKGQEQSIKTIQEFARKRFNELAGFVNQYLFFWARNCL